jgi:hypothetical protein
LGVGLEANNPSPYKINLLQKLLKKTRNANRLLVGKPEGKRPLGRPRRMWVDNNRIDLGEVGWGGVDWIGLAQDRNRWRALVNSGSMKCWGNYRVA